MTLDRFELVFNRLREGCVLYQRGNAFYLTDIQGGKHLRVGLEWVGKLRSLKLIKTAPWSKTGSHWTWSGTFPNSDGEGANDGE